VDKDEEILLSLVDKVRTSTKKAKKPPIKASTRYKRPVRVLVDIEEYERLKAFDTRQVFYPNELDDDQKALFNKGYQDEAMPLTPEPGRVIRYDSL
jgi:hypothetical protein